MSDLDGTLLQRGKMVFGDNINDKEMIQWGHHSYAMEEGREEIKKYANYRTHNVLSTIKEKFYREKGYFYG